MKHQKVKLVKAQQQLYIEEQNLKNNIDKAKKKYQDRQSKVKNIVQINFNNKKDDTYSQEGKKKQ